MKITLFHVSIIRAVPEQQTGIVIMMNVANGEAIDKMAELLINEYTR